MGKGVGLSLTTASGRGSGLCACLLVMDHACESTSLILLALITNLISKARCDVKWSHWFSFELSIL